MNWRLTEELKSYLEELNNGLKQDMNQVFTSVSNGKKKLASALLTKGVSTNEDATFAQLAEAILNIDQKLVIGVEEIPGTIRYQYHYHVDASGNQLHTEKSDIMKSLSYARAAFPPFGPYAIVYANFARFAR